MPHAALPGPLPEILLILGTDLAGKDHFATVLLDTARRAGVVVEQRRALFSTPADERRSTEDKSRFSLLLEYLFLVTLPLHCRLLPLLMGLLIRRDLLRFRRPAQGSLLVVSHTPIRLLAMALGNRYKKVEEIRLTPWIEQVLRDIPRSTGARTVILDIDHRIRRQRLLERQQRGTIDHFDRYMGRNPSRSERIEDFLVWLGRTYLDGIRIENNNASDQELLAFLSLEKEETASPGPGLSCFRQGRPEA